jgi:hypothetical protein
MTELTAQHPGPAISVKQKKTPRRREVGGLALRTTQTDFQQRVSKKPRIVPGHFLTWSLSLAALWSLKGRQFPC